MFVTYVGNRTTTPITTPLQGGRPERPGLLLLKLLDLGANLGAVRCTRLIFDLFRVRELAGWGLSSSSIIHTAPNVYNTVSGVPPREEPFRAIDLGEVSLRPHPT